MRPLRTGSPVCNEMWGESDVMNHLNCDKMKAKEILDAVRSIHGESGYGPVRKDWVLDYIAEKERIQREREMRYQSDLANVESIAVLKEQVKVLQAASDSSSAAAHKANMLAVIAICISAISIFVTIVLNLA